MVSLSAVWEPFLEHLSAKNGAKITRRVYKSRLEFEKERFAGIPDFAFMNPYYAVLMRDQLGYTALVRDGSQILKSIFVVRKSSAIQTVADLQRKTIAFPDANALAAFICGRQCWERRRYWNDEFVSTVNHELPTPLTAVLGSLRLISSNMIASVPEPARGLIDLAERNCDRLSHLINNVLDIQRLQKETTAMDMELVDTPKLVDAVVAANQPFAQKYNVTLRLACMAVPNSNILGDQDKLEQFLTNLLSNAIKFSPVGETVDVRLERNAECVRISIRDRGPGISDDFRQKIFPRFARAHEGSASRAGGSGLGPYISRSIVDQHPGRIDFENNSDAGATFHIVLPAAQMHIEAKHSAQRAPSS